MWKGSSQLNEQFKNLIVPIFFSARATSWDELQCLADEIDWFNFQRDTDFSVYYYPNAWTNKKSDLQPEFFAYVILFLFSNADKLKLANWCARRKLFSRTFLWTSTRVSILFGELTPQHDLEGWEKIPALVLAMQINWPIFKWRLILRKGRTTAKISRIQAPPFYLIFPYCAQT